MPEFLTGKVHATVTATHHDAGHVFATDANGTDYFVFHSAIERTSQHVFTDLRVGSRLKLTPILHPKGPRGIEVQILDL